jgi:hypothetical protein
MTALVSFAEKTARARPGGLDFKAKKPQSQTLIRLAGWFQPFNP